MSKLTSSHQPAIAAYVGLDWGNNKHAIAIQVAGSNKVEHSELEHTSEAIDAWASQLRERFAPAGVAIALEQSRGGLTFCLSKYDHLVLYPVHPKTSAEYRKMFRPSGAKGDHSDAALLLDFLVRHPDRLQPINPDTAETRALQMLVEHRRRWVDERTRCSNRLRADLKTYYPQVLEWFDELYAPVALDLLERWPTLEDLQKAKPQTVRQFLKQHRCSNDKIEQRLQAISQAVALTTDFAVITAGRLATRSAVPLLRNLGEAIQQYDRQIEDLTAAHPDFAIFDSLPGAGAVMVPRLIAAFGTQRQRFQSAAQVQSYSGIAPVTEASGSQLWVHWRWSCPKFLRQTFQEWAALTIHHCDWAAAYYQTQREQKNKSHYAAVRSLAFKWIRIVFRCWQQRTLYNDAQYESTLLRRANQAPANADPQHLPWISCGCFAKISLKAVDNNRPIA